MPLVAERELQVFAREPRLGEVKTRLIPVLGEQGALAAHERLVETSLGNACGVARCTVSLWIAGRPDGPKPVAWAERFGVALAAQSGGSLGERMHRALTAGLGRAQRVVLIGSDVPCLEAPDLERAFLALERAPVVLAPAEDGGYGLVGLRAPAPGLFENVPWGTAEVLTVTLERAAGAGLEVELLPEIWDVDEPEDWARFLSWRQAGHGS